jgi:hypothetical protein
VQHLISPALVARAKSAAERWSETIFYRAYKRYMTQRGSRLAAAMTYSAFLSIFPLVVVGLAVATAVLGKSGVQSINRYIEEQLPGLAGKFSLDDMVSNAAAVGVISGVILLWSGLNWVNTARGSLRMIWCVDDMPGGYLSRKALDLVSLVGFGVTVVVVVAASVLTSGFAATVLKWIDVEDTSAARFALHAALAEDRRGDREAHDHQRGAVRPAGARRGPQRDRPDGHVRLPARRNPAAVHAEVGPAAYGVRRGRDLRGDEGPGDVLRDPDRGEVAVRRVRGADRAPHLAQLDLQDPAGTLRVDRGAHRGRTDEAKRRHGGPGSRSCSRFRSGSVDSGKYL